MNAVTTIAHDINLSPAAGYAEITERVDALLNGFQPRDRAALMVIRAAALQAAHPSPSETAQALRYLAEELETL